MTTLAMNNSASSIQYFLHYFTEQEEKRLFNTVKQTYGIYAQRDYYWMLLMRETAVRLGVLAGPDAEKAKRYNLPMVGLTVGEAEQSLEEGYLIYSRENAKNQKKHPIALNKSAIHALKQLLKIHEEMAATIEWDIPRQDRPLFLSRNRQAMSRRSFQARFSTWCRLANVPDGTPHWLRHTWAIRFLGRTTSPDALRRVQAVLGHSNLSTTAIYTAPDKESIAVAMREASTCFR
ncbi:tyrosine-type recombinase/integrase [Vibrio cholerae]|nr:recombinase XerC [Vibrio cholerae]EHR7681830.1 tyrosine-type recombinase/integrase [Vibrio cholerae]EHT2842178.1 tyrosine-type recombinase/integrase [Vibrio cholerae]EIC9868177.1 tyrosine-type recombinase/integrase [Vibrio cholerae]EII5611444.1 tyrosine-type recombinase/integrase [Vibrio cholerae]